MKDCLGPPFTSLDMGFQAAHTNQVGLGSTDDAVILEVAKVQQQTIVTLDSDFHALMALSGERQPSVIRIRIEGLQWRPLATLIAGVANAHRSDLEAGALVSVTANNVRVRRLPLMGLRDEA